MRIDTKTGRDRLAPRREPYWLKLEGGRFLGYRKTAAGGFWVARYRDGAGKQHYSALGQSSGDDFDDAKRAADEWIRSLTTTGGSIVKTGTVEAVCEAYAANLEAEDRTAAAEDARRRFKQLINGTEFGRTRLDRLDRDAVTRWRDSLRTKERGAAAVNRHLRSIKAALNEGVRMGYGAHPEAWRTVRVFANAERSRDVFLTVKQRRALLEHCPPALHDFVSGLFYTAARPGELARATVADFDLRAKTVTLRTGKGRGGEIRPRAVPLTPDALALFKRCAKGKLPKAPLFPDPAGHPWHRVYLSRALRAAAEAAKLPPGTVGYTIRHTAIAEWLTAGIDAMSVAKMCGTGLVMLQKHYHKFLQTPALEKLAAVKLL